MPEPMLKTNLYYKSAAPMRLYRIADVNAAMETEAYKAASAKAEARKASAQKGLETKRRNGEALIKMIVDEMQVERIDMRELERLTIDAKIEWYDRHGDDLYKLDSATVTRWMVNYVRHNLCMYDNGLMELYGRIGADWLYTLLKNGTLDKIAQAYPELAAECDAQKVGG